MEQDARGRPTKYRPEYDKQAYNYCKLGANDKDLAEFFNCTEQTVNNWKHDYPTFFESLKKGKDIYDAELIESALVRSCTGYTISEHETKDQNGVITTRELTKEVPPNPTSIIFYLTNRNRERWKRNNETELVIKKSEPIEFIKAVKDADTAN
jgi:hypothetical protein